jgi:pimeloyl-ACP methyl ester carboxylesterase
MGNETKTNLGRRRFMASAGAGAVAIGSSVSSSVTAAPARASSGKSTFVLVHGAWHGGWCYRRVADQLSAMGHQVFTPTLTGLADRSHLINSANVTLSTYIDDIVNLIKWEGLNDFILVGHSYGGFVISGVAERIGADKIRSIVFLDAFLPEDGESFLGYLAPQQRDAIVASANRNGGFVPPFSAAFFAVNERDRAWVDSQCTSQPLATFSEPVRLTGAVDQVKRKGYIRAAAYNSPNFLKAMKRASAKQGWKIHEMPCGHDIMLDMPKELTELLLSYA